MRTLCPLQKGGEGQPMLQPGVGFDGSAASVPIVIQEHLPSLDVSRG